jgi:hypothetical protein
MTPEQRKQIARKAAEARWEKVKEEEGSQELEIIEGVDLPVAKYKGTLPLMDLEIPCYVLSDGQRVVGRTGMTEMLTGIKAGGGLEKYLGVSPLKPFINQENVLEKMVAFRLPEVEGLERHVKGLPADYVCSSRRFMSWALSRRLVCQHAAVKAGCHSWVHPCAAACLDIV